MAENVNAHRQLALRVHQSAHLEGTFMLRSGRVASEYFDKYRIEADPVLLLAVAEEMVAHLPGNADVLAGLELGGIPLVTVLAQLTGLPTCFVRKERKPYGTAQQCEGASPAGRHTVLIEDVITSGGAVIDAAQAVRDMGGRVEIVICIIDRQSGGRKALEGSGLELRAIFRQDELVRAAGGSAV